MAATNYTTLIARVRTAGNDTATSNLKLGDVPIGLRNGTNPTFRLAYPNPVLASMYLTYGSSIVRQPAGAGTFSLLDGPSGYVTMLGAGIPDSGATAPFFFDYCYQWFLDADYTNFIDDATDALGGVAGTDLVEGLYPAQVQFALASYWNRRSSIFANQYASAGGGASAAPQTPPVNFQKLADAATKKGITLRDDYYKRFGQRNAPASGTITYLFGKGTPRR